MSVLNKGQAMNNTTLVGRGSIALLVALWFPALALAEECLSGTASTADTPTACRTSDAPHHKAEARTPRHVPVELTDGSRIIGVTESQPVRRPPASGHGGGGSFFNNARLYRSA